MARVRTGRRVTQGRVVKANNPKTRVIAVDESIPHELYGRVLRRTVKYVAHDENEVSQVGDVVQIEECRPMSRTKRWRVLKIVGRDLLATQAVEPAVDGSGES